MAGENLLCHRPVNSAFQNCSALGSEGPDKSFTMHSVHSRFSSPVTNFDLSHFLCRLPVN
jgi:hypothetical protein